MIALAVNQYVWDQLNNDPTLNAQYAKYRTQFGANFTPFFPVYDNHAGDISWGSEPYVLWDSMSVAPRAGVPLELREQVIYTVVAKIPELFDFKDRIIGLFDHWNETTFPADGYRINDVKATQMDRTRGRDKVRQTYSTTLLLDTYYMPC